MLNIFKKIISNPWGAFVYAILSKWYFAVLIASVVVVFWVFKGLRDAGVIDRIDQMLVQSLAETKSIAKHCTPLIARPQALWQCLSNPPRYEPQGPEQELERDLRQFQQERKPSPYDNPYAE